MAPPRLEPDTCGTERQSASHSAIQAPLILLLQLSSRQNNRINLIYSIKMALNQNLEVNASQLAIRPPDLKKIKLRLSCLHSGVIPRNSAEVDWCAVPPTYLY
ncbi:hypothetical protein CEXT_769821 [Caerostris extrusa]|uniref:Uncharacterized protein n=1 Tax=Caerostris extrusa TaxID=172846 RepID=A0AAV4YCD9_CAEEX|nr:hypothetical protein CEXT_769821 [Caerostris extrusa]